MPLDPGFQSILDRLDVGGTLHLRSAVDARQGFRSLVLGWRNRSGHRTESVRDVRPYVLDGPAGPIPVRIYEPLRDRFRVVTYLHGGGWVIGDLDTHDPTCRMLANVLGAVVVSVDYRLAPEHPFPAGLEDAIAAVRWNAARHPTRRHIVAGDSAGAALAIGTAMDARIDGPRLAAQLLIYPPSDPTMSLPAVEQNGTGYFLTRDDMLWFMGHYAPDPAVRTHPAIDLLNAELTGLPPTVIATAELDPLRDDGYALSERLTAARVDVRHVPGPGLIHGYFNFASDVPAADATCRRVLAALEELLE